MTEDTEAHYEQDENYFVSMTDMMVGILFIFIILLMVFALNFRTQTDISEDRIRRLQEAANRAEIVGDRLESLRSQVISELSSMSEANRVRADLLEEIRMRLADLGLVVEIDEANGVLRLTEDAIRFDVDSAELTDRAMINVRKVAEVLAEVVPKYTSEGDRPAHVETVFVEGHTDITGLDETNWALSTNRAVNTYRALTATAPSLRLLRNDSGNEIISVSGYSSTRPVPDQSFRLYDVHRRIDLRFVMELDTRQRLADVLRLTGEMEDSLTDLRRAVTDANAD